MASCSATYRFETPCAGRIRLILGNRVIEPEGMGGPGCDAVPSYPVRLQLHCAFGGVHGYLCIGPRADGSVYGRDELSAVSDLLVPLRRRMMVAFRSPERRLQQKAAQRTIFEQLQSITAQLAELEK